MTQSSIHLLLERFCSVSRIGTRDAYEMLLHCLNEADAFSAAWTSWTMAAEDGMTGYTLTKALVVSASEENRTALSEALSAKGFVPALCRSTAEARKFMEGGDIEILFCDDCLHGAALRNVVAEVAERHRPIPVIAVSRTGEWSEYFDALRAGAFAYLSLPLRREELDRVLESALGKSFGRNDGVKVEATI
jgi:CheY-like chemotaxis protein